jgi:hypothetical protein
LEILRQRREGCAVIELRRRRQWVREVAHCC